MARLLVFFVLLATAAAQSADITTWASRFSSGLDTISEEVLCASRLRDLFASAPAERRAINGSEVVASLANEVKRRVEEKVSAVDLASEVAEAAFSSPRPSVTERDVTLCQDLPADGMRYDTAYARAVDVNASCVRLPYYVDGDRTAVRGALERTSVLTATFADNHARLQTLKWQYFGHVSGAFRTFPARQEDWPRSTGWPGSITLDRLFWAAALVPLATFVYMAVSYEAIRRKPQRHAVACLLFFILPLAAVLPAAYYNPVRTPASAYDPRFRPWYVAASSEAKDLVIVLDVSGSMSARGRLELAKSAAHTLLSTVNAHDRVGVVAFSSEAILPGADGDEAPTCMSSRLAIATSSNIDALHSFVDQLRAGNTTDFTAAFQGAFSLLRASAGDVDGIPRQPVILFITDGQSRNPSSLIEGEKEKLTGAKPIIFTYALGSSVSHQTASILTRVAEDNDGTFTAVADGGDLRTAMGSYYNHPALLLEAARTPDSHEGQDDAASGNGTAAHGNGTAAQGNGTAAQLADVESGIQRYVISPPYYDASGLGYITTVARPVVDAGGGFVGVVGADISMQDIAAEVTFLQLGALSYTFLVESNGNLLLHPNLPTPSAIDTEPLLLDFSALEPELAALHRSSLLGNSTGSARFSALRVLRRGNALEGGQQVNVSATAYWAPAVGTPYHVVLVLADEDAEDDGLPPSLPEPADMPKQWYHRLDLDAPDDLEYVQPDSTCGGRYAYVNVSRSTSSWKLAPRAWKQPFLYLQNGDRELPDRQQGEAHVRQLNSAMNDDAVLEADALLWRPALRSAARLTAPVESCWRASSDSQYASSVVWRYVGTQAGFFRTFPAHPSPLQYDPTQRPWYNRARNGNSRLSLSTYLDSGSSSLVSTISLPLRLNGSEQADAVMGVDLAVDELRSMLLTVEGAETLGTDGAILFDRSGQLVYHEALTGGSLPLAAIEPELAAGLATIGLLEQRHCYDYAREVAQRFYVVNTTQLRADVDTSFPCSGPDDEQLQVRMAAVPDSNVILLANPGCSVGRECACDALLPCSEVPPGCLCPCVLPMNYTSCNATYSSLDDSIPACPGALPSLERFGGTPATCTPLLTQLLIAGIIVGVLAATAVFYYFNRTRIHAIGKAGKLLATDKAARARLARLARMSTVRTQRRMERKRQRAAARRRKPAGSSV